MKGKMSVFLILFFLLVSICNAEESDTVQHELDEVVVTASRVRGKGQGSSINC